MPGSRKSPLTPGLEGTTYQVALLMKYAFEAYKNQENFLLLTEVEELGKFDDIVIHRENFSEVVQVKHAHNEGEHYTLNDFIQDPSKKDKKVQLSKYFDSWVKIKKENPNRQIIFKLISSYSILLKFNARSPKTKINEHHLVLGKGFTEAFIDGINLNGNDWGIREEIIKSIIQYSMVLGKTDNAQTRQWIINFLKDFYLETGQQSVQELDQWLKAEILGKFNTVFPMHYEAFYLEMLMWLRDANTAHDQASIDNFFKKISARAALYSLVGITEDYVNRSLSIVPPVYKNGDAQVTSFKSLRTKTNLVVVTGESFFANNALLKACVESKQFKSGEYVFFRAKLILDEKNNEHYLNIFLVEEVKLIVISDANLLFDGDRLTLRKWQKEAIRTDKKLVLLTTLSEQKIQEQIPLQGVEFKEVPLMTLEQVQQVCSQQTAFRLFGKQYQLIDILKLPEWHLLSTTFRNLNHLVAINELQQEQILEPGFGEESLLPYTPPEVMQVRYMYALGDLIEAANYNFNLIQIQLSENNIDQVEKLIKQLIVEKNPGKKCEKIHLGEFDQNIQSDFLIIDAVLVGQIEINAELLEFLRKNKNIILLLPVGGKYLSTDSTLHISHVQPLNEKWCGRLEYSTNVVLPQYVGKIEEPFVYQSLLEKAGKPGKALIQASAGLGKSRLSQELVDCWQNKNQLENTDYLFVFRIELPQITKQDKRAIIENNCLGTICNFLVDNFYANPSKNISAFEKELLFNALKQGQVLLIADGFDEVLPGHYCAAREIFDAIYQYEHLVLVSRPSANFPVVPEKVLTIEYFDRQKIVELVRSYLIKDKFKYAVDTTFFDLLAEQLTDERLFNLLKTPLHCQLFCQVLFHQDEPPTAEEIKKLTKLSLYQQLVSQKLKIFLEKELRQSEVLSEERAYLRCGKALKTICKYSYQQIGFDPDADLNISEVNAEDIGRIALNKIIKVNEQNKYSMQFEHQTFQEYFAAVFIAKALCNKYKEKAFGELIVKYRYDRRFIVVWQFLARILLEGDAFISKDKRQKALEKFCGALFAKPRDLLGVQQVELIRFCFEKDDVERIVHSAEIKKCMAWLLNNQAIPVTPIVRPNFVSQKPSIVKKQLTGQERFDEAIKIFGWDFDQRSDRGSFQRAHDNFVSLQEESLRKKAISFLKNFIEKKQVKNLTWKNKAAMALKVLAKLDAKCEKLIVDTILEVFFQNNSDSVDSDLLAAMSVLSIFENETFEKIKAQIISAFNAGMFLACLKCLKNSPGVISEAGIIELIKSKILLIDYDQDGYLRQSALEYLANLSSLSSEDTDFLIEQLIVAILLDSSNGNLLLLIKNCFIKFSSVQIDNLYHKLKALPEDKSLASSLIDLMVMMYVRKKDPELLVKIFKCSGSHLLEALHDLLFVLNVSSEAFSGELIEILKNKAAYFFKEYRYKTEVIFKVLTSFVPVGDAEKIFIDSNVDLTWGLSSEQINIIRHLSAGSLQYVWEKFCEGFNVEQELEKNGFFNIFSTYVIQLKLAVVVNDDCMVIYTAAEQVRLPISETMNQNILSKIKEFFLNKRDHASKQCEMLLSGQAVQQFFTPLPLLPVLPVPPVTVLDQALSGLKITPVPQF